MRIPTARSTLRLIAMVACAGAMVAGCGGDPDAQGGITDADPDVTFDIVIEDGGVVGGPQTLRVESGDVVRLSIESDDSDEVHVHGVDVELEVGGGEVADVTFEAGSAGSYEVELHDAGTLVGTMEVR